MKWEQKNPSSNTIKKVIETHTYAYIRVPKS